MKQLNIFCEGATEQAFCTQVLQPHLFPRYDGIIHTLAVGEKDHHHLYGLGSRIKYQRVRKFIRNTIKDREGPQVFFTTLFDLYALQTDFPGRDANAKNPANPTPYVMAIEESFRHDIDYYRFIPYIQLHEFETILFAGPDAFAIAFENCDNQIRQLHQIAVSETSIEFIDDGRDTAPSKRIISIIPEYEGRKASAGPDIATCIGLPTIRDKCPHFDRWVAALEELPWNDE